MNSPVMENVPKGTKGSMAGDSIRLNLGGRDTTIPGFKTVDVHLGPTVDYATDISDLSMFKNNSVEELYCSHCLEHFPHVQTKNVLTEWYRVLKPGRKCYISVPDFDAALKLARDLGLTDFIRNLLWGDQGYDKAYHYTGFTFSSLSLVLIKAGFSDVKRLKWMPYNLKDCSRLVDTVNKLPISLSVEATK